MNDPQPTSPRGASHRIRLWFGLLLLLGLGAGVWLRLASAPSQVVQAHARENIPVGSAGAVLETTATETVAALPEGEDAPSPPEAVETVPSVRRAAPRRQALEAVAGPEAGPGLTPVLLLQNMRRVLSDYSARFGGNPVGNNREISAALNGANPKQVVFLKPEDGMRLNARGELIDNWGTPFFFHQLSATEMEIHSAGPDGKLWTADDLVLR